MKKLNNILLMMFIFLSFSCDDILEEDITDDNVQAIYPTEGAAIDGNTVQFSWQNLDGVDNYRVQIIKSNQTFEIDSLVATNMLTVILNPGTYQWRVRGENFAYQTAYSFPINFSTQASTNLTDQDVTLLSPSNNLYTRNINVIFTWNALTNATSYDFELIKKLTGEQTVFQETDINSTNLTIDATLIDEDAEYIWKVKALNHNSETQYSQRSFFLDREAPNQPALTSPENQATASTMVTFNWTNGTDTGNIKSEITNTIEIATDANFNVITYLANTSNNSVQYEFVSTGTYYWRIKAIDAANNESNYSIVRSLIVE